ncbi:3-oxo-tetronate 4-phosphate decarboxylase [Aureimonas sp. SK2]|uniref:3-oxo-tetronate 4-phosphate decarboxylase n=1 Tax=Aureimonas sp. SK2 TaxID=3015992 RepID=UPI0024452BA8|nr:3-oxo-tetronate 4-phosphate decarboxylase [Aureimonas sp. SK2]
MSLSSESRLRESICRMGREFRALGLAPGTSGNLSARLDDGWLMTPTNVALGNLDPARISKLDWGGRLVSGDKPTKESFLHRAFYENRPEAGAVVHLHATHATALSCLEGLNEDSCIEPITPYFVMRVGRLPLLPYFRPGDPAMGEAVAKVAPHRSSVLLANHGPVVSGPTLEAAQSAMEELEETARLVLLLRGQAVRTLGDAEIQPLREAFNAIW